MGYIKILFALMSENLREKLAWIFKYITYPELFASHAVQIKKGFSLFDNGVQSELCNCLNGEVMRAQFYLLLSGGMIQFFRS